MSSEVMFVCESVTERERDRDVYYSSYAIMPLAA